jgi:hypothetical protein
MGFMVIRIREATATVVRALTALHRATSYAGAGSMQNICKKCLFRTSGVRKQLLI